MQRIIYLARHGETSWNREGRWQGHTDIALNEAGLAQARALGEFLRARTIGRGIARIYASDLARARQTAEAAAAILGVTEIVVDAALRERSFGIFEGLTRGECAQRHPDHWRGYRSDPSLVPPGAESQDALAARMQQAVARAVVRRNADDDAPVLIVSHGGSIRTLIARATGTMPPPLENGAVFSATVVAGALRDVACLT
ncbi:MAG TPA: histidine phosphatase family protein [Polyangia bacterium]|nr:histidine phosphatase family protein [Polyangia bacterium]